MKSEERTEDKPTFRFAVEVTRIAYSTKTIEVEASDPEEAERKAESEAGNYSFPNEHSSEYESQGATLIT